MAFPLSELIGLCHLALSGSCGKGDTVLDATAGRGHDTLFLASLVGAEGRVLALDRQEEALSSAAVLLRERGMENRVRLMLVDHAEMAELLERELPVASSRLPMASRRTKRRAKCAAVPR